MKNTQNSTFNFFDKLIMKQLISLKIFDAAMALFGMVWMMRVRSEINRCSKCHQDDLQINNYQHQYQQFNDFCRKKNLPQTPEEEEEKEEDEFKMSANNSVFTVDSPTALPNSYCEVHGYITLKEGTNIEATDITF